ncbi:flagellar biosynthesis protein FlhF [Wenzhouxiangella sp. XN24]|uniref:flagellar biosynthesis protein FlhF n=1 Tax=Wenzhouxiangella sp. XN24 TaxID=2713569 RepID=UPI0013EA55DD|nr:flagellar biosynthesis protein FlhF [Wenzhouxiangella sp. XN24]NGX16244.1 flagellar biosynthesis protein FlhF [Wenzhouxiangella sp. XN24]
MKIKRFFAPDMRRAICLVREEQGPDAVILSTRNTAGGVEIVAAVDYDAELVNGMFGEQREQRGPGGTAPGEDAGAQAETVSEDVVAKADDPGTTTDAAERRPESDAAARERIIRAANSRRYETAADDGGREPAQVTPAASRRTPAPRIEWTQDPTLSAMQDELKSLRAILQDQVSRLATADYDRREPVRAEIVRRFVKFGFDEAVARGVAAATTDLATPGEAWREALFGLAKRLPVAARDPLEQCSAIALVGATGVGKTTSAAKLAARACLRYGSNAVALISTDDIRVGAQRQLASFGLLLGLPVRQARSAAELADQLAEFDNRRIVIIDTAGMGQRDVRLIDETRKLTRVADLQSYLVLSANVQREVMDEIVNAFGREQLAGCILTKLDEAARLGAALSTIVSHQLPVAFLSEGQRVPEDLRLARAKDLVGRAFAPPGGGSRSRTAPPAEPSREVRYESA